jgi:hypothetical protein
VSDVTLLDSWVISAQGYFTKNTDLFPGKISNNLKGCPMKAVIKTCVESNYSNGIVGRIILGFQTDLVKVVVQRMNMTFLHVTSPDGSKEGEISQNNLIRAMIAKEAYIAVGHFRTDLFLISYFDYSNSYLTSRFRWYVPCSVKYPRWSSIFRVLSVELWIVLIISIVIAAISTTLFGR